MIHLLNKLLFLPTKIATLQVLEGITPSRAFSFISDMYGGSIFDRELFIASGLNSYLWLSVVIYGYPWLFVVNLGCVYTNPFVINGHNVSLSVFCVYTNMLFYNVHIMSYYKSCGLFSFATYVRVCASVKHRL